MARQIFQHLGSADPTKAFPTLKPRELSVNTANRQIALGHETTGAPLSLIAIRYFDARASYATDDLVVQVDKVYRAKAAVPPGAFNAADWTVIVPVVAAPTARQAMLPGVYINFDHARDAMLADGTFVSR
jgi:hypothetical protein